MTGGGIEIRNDVDRSQGRVDLERDGISQNTINHASIRFGGGPVSTLSRSVDPIQLSEARAEISYNTITNNANGQGGLAAAEREGRGPNSPATIHVTGAQPTIVGNTFTHNDGAVISINANAMVGHLNGDGGRQTDPVERYPLPPGNVGPAIRGNQLGGNEINGMRVRGGQLYTESIWDDTDIVHVLTGDISMENFHVYTLKSAPGHGYTELDNRARPAREGGGSLRFGFDPINDDFNRLSENSLEPYAPGSDRIVQRSRLPS